MARQPRFDFAGIPQHVVQRGNNRLPCFLDDEDRQRYLQCLRQGLARFDCQLHAYVLMSNHVHLLLTPQATGAVSRLMHTLARNCCTPAPRSRPGGGSTTKSDRRRPWAA